jgi:hypothetical protein
MGTGIGTVPGTAHGYRKRLFLKLNLLKLNSVTISALKFLTF